MAKITPTQIRSRKNKDKIVCLTAYTTPMAKIMDDTVDLILVGDSVGMVLHGMDNTLGVTLEMMIMHGRAVTRGAKRACVIVDMPYGTYEDSTEIAVNNARRIIKETGADGVKLEGGTDMATQINAIVDAGIPVMAHIGLQPQSVEKEGGYKIKGRTDEETQRLLDDAKAATDAGAFSVVIEGTLPHAAAQISQSIAIPTIGIGASAACDGQVLVTDDMLGLTSDHTPKFVKQYAQINGKIEDAIKAYADEVRSSIFPTQEHCYK